MATQLNTTKLYELIINGGKIKIFTEGYVGSIGVETTGEIKIYDQYDRQTNFTFVSRKPLEHLEIEDPDTLYLLKNFGHLVPARFKMPEPGYVLDLNRAIEHQYATYDGHDE